MDTISGWKLVENSLPVNNVGIPVVTTPKPPKPLEPQTPDPKRFRFRITETEEVANEIRRYKGAMWELAGTDREKYPSKNPELKEQYWTKVKIGFPDSLGLYKIKLSNTYTKKVICHMARPVYEGRPSI